MLPLRAEKWEVQVVPPMLRTSDSRYQRLDLDRELAEPETIYIENARAL